MVITTDSMVEGYDFLAHATTPAWIGHKTAVQNMADVAAIGARPLALVAAVSTPGDTPVEWFEQVTIGLTRRAARDGAQLVGGDLGRADQCTLTITAVGALEDGEEPVLRSGARPGDVIAIGAPLLGRSAAGLTGVLSGRVEMDPTGVVLVDPGLDPELAEELREMVGWHNAPDPDLSLGWTTGRTAHAMMDLSDGLVRDGSRIAAASGVLLDLASDLLAPDVDALRPVADCLGADAWEWVLHGGEEHAMLAAFGEGEVPEGFRPIGRVLSRAEQGHSGDGYGGGDGGTDGYGDSDGPRVLLDGGPIAGTGFDHFD